MDKEWKDIAEKLPVQPCQDLINDVFNSVYESGERELGTPMLLFHREAVSLEEPIKEIMTPETGSGAGERQSTVGAHGVPARPAEKFHRRVPQRRDRTGGGTGRNELCWICGAGSRR